MLKQLQFAYPSEVCNIHYVSCMHLGHDRSFIYQPRGFGDVHEHDETLVQRWNERVKPCDIVHSLGDTIFGEGAATRLEAFFKRLNFWKLYLSPGNHFAGWKQLYNRTLEARFGPKLDFEVYPLELKIADNKFVYFMPNLYEAYVGHQAVVLCHYPVIPHNGAGKGTYGIFGHCHGNHELTHPETGRGRILDVCIESFGRPVSYKEIETIFKTRTPWDVSHHTRGTTYPI